MIRETIQRFISRVSDLPFFGRNNTRIILGTDRKSTVNSGFGDGGENREKSPAIEICAGGTGENVDHINDKSKLYLSALTNPDEYFGVSSGEEKRETAAGVLVSDQVYLLGRKNIKLVNKNGVSVLIKEDGSIEINASDSINIKSGNSVINLNSNGSIEIGSANGLSSRIITENDVCVGEIPPGATGLVHSRFVGQPTAFISNQNVKIKT